LVISSISREREGLFEESLAVVGVGAMLGQLLEIMAGREDIACRCDDHHTHVVVLVRILQLAHQCLHHGDRQVIGGRIVQRQAQDAFGKLAQHERPAGFAGIGAKR
jgi:hypothetical protein